MAKNNHKPAKFCKLGHKMSRGTDGEWRCAECRRQYMQRYHLEVRKAQWANSLPF